MPITWSKHQDEALVTIDDLSGGINVGKSRHLIEDNEAEWIENMYYDPADGRLKTRWPFANWTYDSPVYSMVRTGSLYFWRGVSFLQKDNILKYRLSSSSVGTIGTLSGDKRATFCPFYDRLYVASGGQLQYIDTSLALNTETNGPKCQYIFQKDSRLVATGDPDNLDRVWQCAVFDPTSWDSGNDYYADVGYKDGLDVNGIYEAFDGLYIVFKRGDHGMKAYFLTNLDVDEPKCRKISEQHVAMSHFSVKEAGGKLYFLEDKGVTRLVGMDERGKIVVDETPGLKLAGVLDCTETAFAEVYPPDKQIWFSPNQYTQKIFIYHYQTNAWTLFSIPLHSQFYITSLYFYPKNKTMFIGVVILVGITYISAILYYDTHNYGHNDYGSVDIKQQIRTKVFDVPSNKDKILKSPEIFYEGIADSTADDVTIDVRYNLGKTSYDTKTFTIDAGTITLYDTGSTNDLTGSGSTTDGIYLYDTKDGGDNEMYLYDIRSSSIKSWKYDQDFHVNDFQFWITVNSGAWKFDKLTTLVATGQKK